MGSAAWAGGTTRWLTGGSHPDQVRCVSAMYAKMELVYFGSGGWVKRKERVDRKRRGGGRAGERVARVTLRRSRKDGVLLIDRSLLNETFILPCVDLTGVIPLCSVSPGPLKLIDLMDPSNPTQTSWNVSKRRGNKVSSRCIPLASYFAFLSTP